MKGWTEKQVQQLKDKGRISAKACKPKVSANALTQQVLRVLGLKGWQVWRQNNGGVYDPVKKVFRANSSTPGISDILGFHKKTGQVIACEIKANKDRLSDEQEAFLQAVNDAGGIGRVVRNSDDIENLMKEV